MAKKTDTSANEPKASVGSGGVATFAIDAGDPFVDGAARAYKGNKMNPTARPLILSADDPAALAALKNYRLRAAGGCDLERTKAADKALALFEKATGKSG